MELLWMRNMVLVSLILVEISWTRPIDEDLHLTADDIQLAKSYLRRFYSPSFGGKDLRSPPRRIRSSSPREQKIRQMQNFFGLRETGILDSETLDVMKKPRCGVPDLDNYSFYPYRPKWKNYTISYTITKYTSDMSKLEVEKAFRLALKMWSDAAPLSFIKVDHGKADIVLSFARKAHGDFSPFDGPGGVLAHAFQPGEGVGGDVHFDEDETWTTGMQGYNLFAVAAHEFGHSLGLTHSRDPSAVMFPNYRLHSSKQYALSRDDVLGIQMLYGKPRKDTETRPPVPKKCDPTFFFDAAAVIENEIVFFKNRFMWMRTTRSTYWNRLREGYISTYLPGIGSPVDAAYDIPAKGVTYLFAGRKYWVVQQLKTRSTTGNISEFGLPPSVRQVDAAVHNKEYGKTIFFIGPLYYSYDENRSHMDPGFPRLTQTDWPGIPRRVDAAFKLHGSIFLLSGTKSYQYDFRQKRVVNIITGNSWLGC
ncbi:matrix metalloproteinase-20 [Cyprinodon tularosa]|uniref:matrix metalloproteinase-20 n=1 Tax=Cyprinodon tularosa TaxID=77115 RepID=UPI0018E281DC|nr:matrix metalloproteinase-20 [Cyprinodon tularosa]